MTYLVDTDYVADYLGGMSWAQELLQAHAAQGLIGDPDILITTTYPELWRGARTPIPDLFIAEMALHHSIGVVHVDGDFDRIAEVRPLALRRLRRTVG